MHFNKIRLSHQFIIVVLCILILKLWMDGGIRKPSFLRMSCDIPWNRVLIHQAERTVVPGLSYVLTDYERFQKNWIIEWGFYATPYFAYVNGRIPNEKATEDSIIQEILAAQEMDEHPGFIATTVEEIKNQTGNVKTNTEPVLADTNSYRISDLYTIDQTTELKPDQLNLEQLKSVDLSIQPEDEILVYHTHSQEGFADSTPGDLNTTIVGMGSYLCQLLSDKYGRKVIHHDGVYDLIHGRLDRSKAYQLSERGVRKLQEEHPNIKVVIDLHRDGIAPGKHLVTEIEGKKTAQIMFFNGLSHTKKNGDIEYLNNPYMQDNLAFSLQMQLAAKARYPEFVRHIYLKGYRYNMHLCPRYLLIEAGAQTNTVEEMRHAMEILAEILDHVL